jgi:lysophospholipid acyltransferase (LPLAT)-like uncharacterized protein
MSLKTVQLILAFILAGYMGFVRWTTRWKIEGKDTLKPLQDSGEGFIACSWHSRFLMTTAGWSKMKQKPHVLISRSRDGNLVAYTSKFLKLGAIRGSRRGKINDKEKGGASALRDMLHTLESGDCIFMTPDGPRGPRMRMGEGPIRLAKLSGAPLLAYGLSTSNKILFNSWDRFMLPLPFGRGKIIFAGPVWVGSDADESTMKKIKTDFENMLNTATQQCDKDVGNEVVYPRQVKKKTARNNKGHKE